MSQSAQALRAQASFPTSSAPSEGAERSLLATPAPVFRPTPWWKRSFDVVVALAGLVVLSPFLLLVGLTIKLGSPGPIFFRQWRVGAGEKRFRIWKFRTLRADHDASRHQQHVTSLMESGAPIAKPDHSKRLVWLGGFYRRHGIDELPQLLNVLGGEMSIVGPRPDVLDASCYMQTQRQRFEVAPGITGLWQVSGKNRLTFEEMVEKDIYYVHHRSPWLDGWILLKTIPVLLGAGEN